MRYTPGPHRRRKTIARTPPLPAAEAQRFVDRFRQDPTFEPVGRGMRCSFGLGDRLPDGADQVLLRGFRPNYRKSLDARFDLGPQWPDPPGDGPVRGVDIALDALDRFTDAGLHTWISFEIVLRHAPADGPPGLEKDVGVVAAKGWASVSFASTVTQTRGWSEIEQTTFEALGCPDQLLSSEAMTSDGFSVRTMCPPMGDEPHDEPPDRIVQVDGPDGWVRAADLRRLLGALGGWVQGGRLTAEGPVRHRDVVAAELVAGRLGALATGGWVGFYAYGLRDVTAAGALAESEEAYRFGSVGVRGHRVDVDLIVARGADGEPTYRLSADTGFDGPDAAVVLTEDWNAPGPAGP